MKWLAVTSFLAFPRKIIRKAIFSIFSIRNGEFIYFDDPERSSVFALIKKIKNEREMLLHNVEAYQIFMAVKRTAKINGDVAEVGVYKGGSAKIICEAKGDKAVHLFDTFEGLPDLSALDNQRFFQKGRFLYALEDVKIYLKEYSNVHFYKGVFPLTAEPIKNKRFSFVHLDVDLYESTLNCLEFFYPRINKGGVIISHDYIHVLGVKKAIDDFFKVKPEPILELTGTQCLIVKC